MPFSLDPDLIENNDVKITTNASNEFVLEHKITGNTLTLGSNGTLAVDSLSTGETHTETIGATDYHYAGDYDGADAESRLDNAFSAMSKGEKIYLEDVRYENDRTITTPSITVIGTGGREGDGTHINAHWYFGNQTGCTVKDISRVSGKLTMATNSLVTDCETFGGECVSEGNDVVFKGLRSGSVTFQSGTSNGIVDASTRVSVTDNGTNTVGDIA